MYFSFLLSKRIVLFLVLISNFCLQLYDDGRIFFVAKAPAAPPFGGSTGALPVLPGSGLLFFFAQKTVERQITKEGHD